MAKVRIKFENHPYQFKEWCLYDANGHYLCKEATLDHAVDRVYKMAKLKLQAI